MIQERLCQDMTLSHDAEIHAIADVSQTVPRGRLCFFGDVPTLAGSSKLWSFELKRQG